MAFNFSNSTSSGKQSQNWFRIIDDESDVIYQLTVTTDISVEENSKVVSHKVQDNSVVTDNIVAYNRKVSYNGLVTSVERLDQDEYKDPFELLEGLSLVRTNKTIVTCELDNLLTPITNCAIEKLSYSKSTQEGLTSWRVNISLQEIRLSDAVTSTTVAAPNPKLKGATDPVENVGNATTKKPPLTETILRGGS